MNYYYYHYPARRILVDLIMRGVVLTTVATLLFSPLSQFFRLTSSLTTAADAAFNSTPDPAALTANAAVNSIIALNDKVYLGGEFGGVGGQAAAGGQVFLSATAGTLVPSFPAIIGSVYTAVPDTSGGWYIGGDFTQVGGQARNRLAHILNNNTVDPSFDPNANDSVNELKLTSDGSLLYAAGVFSTIGGASRAGLAALRTTDGTATSFNPGGSPSEIILNSFETILYVAGEFASIGGASRNYIAAIRTDDGTATVWNPNADSPVNALALSSDGTTLYAGGAFTTIGGASRNNLAAINTSDGAATIDFNPNPDDRIRDLALNSDSTVLYAGGYFANVGGSARNYVAGISTTDGTATAFNPNANARIEALTVASNDATVYMGGSFTYIGGANRNHLAAVLVSNSTATSFNPSPNSDVNDLGLSADNSNIFVGGNFTTIGSSPAYLTELNSTATAIHSLNVGLNGNIQSMALSSDGSLLYIGGGFTRVGNTARRHVAAINTNTGLLTSFNPNVVEDPVGGTDGVYALVLASNDATLYVGGSFTSAGGQSRGSVAAINTTTGLATSFSYDASNFSSNDVVTMALSLNNSILYLGGNFDPKIRAVNATTGVATSFAPALDNSVGDIKVSPDGNTLYVAGDFTDVNGTTRNRIAAFDTSSGNLLPFDPNLDNTFAGFLPTPIKLLPSPDGLQVYVTGDFTTVGGDSRPGLAVVNLSDSSATVFSQSDIDAGIALALSPDNSKLYVGNSAYGATGKFFDLFNGPGLIVTFTYIAIEEGGSGTVDMVLNSQPTGDVVVTPHSTNSDVTVNQATYTFTNGNWDTPQTITVSAAEDDDALPDSAVISFVAASSDDNYDGATILDVAVAVNENDIPGVTIAESGGVSAVTEGGASDTYTLVLTTEPTADVTITMTPDAQLTVDHSNITFTTSNWATPQTIVVTAVNDSAIEGTHSGIISHTSSSVDTAYNGLTIASLTVGIADNDVAPSPGSSGGSGGGGGGAGVAPGIIFNPLAPSVPPAVTPPSPTPPVVVPPTLPAIPPPTPPSGAPAISKIICPPTSSEVDLAPNSVIRRLLAREQMNLGVFGILFGHLPSTTGEWKAISYLTYGGCPTHRILNMEVQALVPFTQIFPRVPGSAFDWLMLHVLAYTKHN